jgi:hypothetical protein
MQKEREKDSGDERAESVINFLLSLIVCPFCEAIIMKRTVEKAAVILSTDER